MIALILTVTMAAMGFAAATARGQAMAGGQVLVLCSGGGLVQLTLDADGKPTGETHLCPDLAFSLIAACEIATPTASPPETLSEPLVARAPLYLTLTPRPASQARGPPVSA